MKKILLASFILGSIFSCSNDDNGSVENNTDTILPAKIVSTYNQGKYSSTATFTYDGNKLKEVNTVYPQEDNLVEKEVYQYEGDYITKIITYSGSIQDMEREFTYKNGKIATSKTTEWDNDGDKHISTSTYQWVNNNNVKVTTTQKSPENNTHSYTDEFFYENGNLVKSNFNNNNAIYVSTYDVNNSPFINIKGVKEISLDDEIRFSKNNPILISEVDNQYSNGTYQYTYEYNDKKFPTKSIELYKNSYTNDSNTTNYYYNK